MKWGITGTPGTGKTTATRILERDIIHLSEILEQEKFQQEYDEERNTHVVDIEAVQAWVDDQPDTIIIESHLAHLLPVDRVIVLRCHPGELRDRLKDRSHPRGQGIDENVEAERLDVILSEAVSRHSEDHVFEIDTTERSPEAVAELLAQVLNGTRRPAPGTVSFLGES